MDVRALAFTLLWPFSPVLYSAGPGHAGHPAEPGGLHEGGRPGRQFGRPAHVRGALVVTEVALAFVLLTGAGLLIRSFFQMQQVDTGFDSTNV